MTTVAGSRATGGTRRRSATARTAVPLPERSEPWGRGAWVVLLLLTGLGLLGMFLAWLGISDTADLEEQARWLGLGIGSLIVSGAGTVGWLLAGLINVGALRRQVLREVSAHAPANWAALDFAVPPPDAAGRFGIATGMRRYHRPECDLLVGKNVRWLDAESLAFAVAEACGMCQPDDVSGTLA